MTEEVDIVEQLVDFEHFGLTAQERVDMRLKAAMLILQMRLDLKAAKLQRGELYRRLNEVDPVTEPA